MTDIIKCEDCVQYENRYCHRNGIIVKPTDFCSGAEEKMKIRRGDVVFLKEEQNENNGNLLTFKKRPFLVVSNDLGNERSGVCIVVPLTSKLKRLGFPTHVVVSYNESVALCEQIFTINKDDIKSVAYHLYGNQMLLVDAALKISLGVN